MPRNAEDRAGSTGTHLVHAGTDPLHEYKKRRASQQLRKNAGRQGEQIAGGTREHVNGKHAGEPQKRFAQNAQVPQAPHVGGEMREADVHKHGRHQPPPLAVQHQKRVVCPEMNQLAGFRQPCIHTGTQHEQEDGYIDAEQQISRGGPQVAV